MACIRIYHPDEAINAKLRGAGFKNRQTIKEREALGAVGIILRTTNLNVMIERKGMENTTVWVDTGTFLNLRKNL